MLKRDTLYQGNLKPVRSFVAREGKVTLSQKEVLQSTWSEVGLDLKAQKLDFAQIFGRVAPLTLEIGFGDGRSLINLAKDNPHQDYIGIEVYKTGIAKLCAGIKANNLTNIRIFCADAIEVLKNSIPDESLDCVQLFFPDPWPKSRHHKRRIVQSNFVALIWEKLKKDGIFHMATDWEPYANYMLTITQMNHGFENTAGLNNFAIRPTTRILTKFECRGTRLGYGTWDLIFRKCHDI